jgi:hypothetical protein
VWSGEYSRASPPLDVLRIVVHWAKSGSVAALLSTVIAYRMIRARALAAELQRAVHACWLLHSKMWRACIFVVAVCHSVLAYTTEFPTTAAWPYYAASWACVCVQVAHVLLARFVERCGPSPGHSGAVEEAGENCAFLHETLWTTFAERHLWWAQVVLIAASAADLIAAASYAPYGEKYQHLFMGALRPIMLYLVSYQVRASFAQCFKAIVNARNIFLVALSLLVVSTFVLLTLLKDIAAPASSDATKCAEAAGISYFETTGSFMLDSFLQAFVFLFAGENFFDLALVARNATQTCTVESACLFAVCQEALLIFSGFAGARTHAGVIFPTCCAQCFVCVFVGVCVRASNCVCV